MTAPVVFVQKLAQSFVEDGNVFLMFERTTGDIDARGQDVAAPALTLIIPAGRIHSILKNFETAAAQIPKFAEPDNSGHIAPAQDEYLGGVIVVS